MEAAAPARRELSSDKAARIVDAMRESVARRGAAGSTFEHVAREAGVSRGLLHYYFGTKERLLAEVVRRDTELKVQEIDAALAPARTVDEVLDILVASLEHLIEHQPETFLLLFELFTTSRRNPEIQEELTQHFARIRERLGERLEAKQEEGVLRLRYSGEAVASYLYAIADGIALQTLCGPGGDPDEAMSAHVAAARFLLTDA